VLDAERRKSPIDTVGYFISLDGFTETAIQQERDLGEPRVLLLDGHDVIRDLIKGRILTTKIAAYAAATICAGTFPDLVANPVFEILAHPLGFIWVIYYELGKKRTHVSFIHADGTPLHESLGQDLLALPHFAPQKLIYLAPKSEIPTPCKVLELARTDYFSYLESDCGVIQLEGLPADQEVGSRKLRLESIFVPSHLMTSPALSSEPRGDLETKIDGDANKDSEIDIDVDVDHTQAKRIPAGEVLSQSKRIAILGLPGSGKSTLLKRLSTAYAFPQRMDLVNDSLPRQEHFPIFIRCRQLGDKVREPILELVKDIPKRIEMSSPAAVAFSLLVEESLRSGRALLLVDGLDEISNPGDRVAFVTQLRTFLHRYPAISLVLTSREAGFRIVGSALSTVCKHFVLADFDSEDIMRLTLGWHKEVVGDRPDIAADAHDLGLRICSIPRVRQLAENPLLLTTLLLVRRWVGSLPTKRSVLYAKAIEVLLATWNVEGHAPLEQDEVVPQLEYLAFSMMRDGMQQIGLEPLRSLLIEAREAMPEILSYTKTSPGELIDRIELRSSLLMQSGVDVIDGVLMPVYEFRHLTFQEFLCAQAIVTNHFPGATDSDTPLSVLTPYLKKESWQEVVLLTMVLAGKRAAPIVQELIAQIRDEWRIEGRDPRRRDPAQLLLDALVDEIQLTPDLLREAFRKVVSNLDIPTSSLSNIYTGKYRDALVEVTNALFFREANQMLRAGSVLANIESLKRGLLLERIQLFSRTLAKDLHSKLDAGDWKDQSIELLLIMEHAYRATDPKLNIKEKSSASRENDHLIPLALKISEYYKDPIVQLRLASIWAFNWLNNLIPNQGDDAAPQIGAFFDQLLEEDNAEVQYLLGWSMSTFDILPATSKPLGLLTDTKKDFIEKALVDTREPSTLTAQLKRSALIAAYYFGLVADAELLNLIGKTNSHFDRHLAQIAGLLREKLKSTTPIGKDK
jgi:NACHT domain